MKIWPWLLDLTVGGAERDRPLHLWLPLFLLWPLLLFVALLALAASTIADAVLWLVGRPYHHYSRFVYRIFALISDTRGMVVKVRDDRTVVDMTVY